TPPSPTHGTPFTEITASTHRSPIIPRRRVMILAPGQPIPHGRPYRYHPNGPASSNFHSDASSDSSSRHSLSDHSSPDLPSTSAGPSCKRRRSPMTFVPVLPPASEALSLVCSDLIASPKRVRDSGYLADVDVGPRETSLRDDVISRGSDEPRLEQYIDPKIQAEIVECFAYADALRDKGTDARVVVEAVDQDEIETDALRDKGTDARVVVEAVDQDEIETGVRGPLSQSYTGYSERPEGGGHRIIGVELAVTALTERVAKLERDNRRLRGTTSVESQRGDRLRRGMKMPNTRSGASMTHEEIEDLVTRLVAKEIEAREAAMN
nr:hypothetical protein [Tanacetum cinerariifolium]